MAVKQVLEQPNTNSRIPRWGLALVGVKLDIQPRKGTTNQNVDALSRLPLPTETACFDIDNFGTINVTIEQSESIKQGLIESIQKEQENDRYVKLMKILDDERKSKEIDGIWY